MRRSLVLTLLGPDRPGLVEAMAALIARHGGNWLESRMASLAGEFAGILRVEVDEDSAAELGARCARSRPIRASPSWSRAPRDRAPGRVGC